MKRLAPPEIAPDAAVIKVEARPMPGRARRRAGQRKRPGSRSQAAVPQYADYISLLTPVGEELVYGVPQVASGVQASESL